jgi:HK97 family phage portal protein
VQKDFVMNLSAAINPLNWFRRSSPENQATSLEKPGRWFVELFGASTKSGVQVTEETALGHSAVYACCNVLAETVASLPLEVYEKMPNGDNRLAEDHPVFELVNSAPNGFQTSYDFRSAGQICLGLRGNFYARVVRDGMMRPERLRPLVGDSVRPVLVDGDQIFYVISGEKEPVAGDDIIHIKGISMDGVKGKSPIQCARESIGLGLSANNYSASLFSNGTRLAGYIEHPTKLTKEQADSLKDNWKANNTGIENAGGVAVLQGGMKFVPTSMTADDAQFVQTMKLSVEEIARIYRVPLHLIGSLDKATFSNIEQQSLEFVIHTVRPLVKRWEQELNRKLFRIDERKRFSVRFNLDALLRGDSRARAEFYTKLFQVGALSSNDIRKREGMNPREGGDEYYVQLNMAGTAENVGEPKTDPNDDEQGSNSRASASA